MQSPEETGHYECPLCGNTCTFIGYDDRGFPGPDECECGKDPCECQVTLKQHFVVHQDGEVDYHAFEGGGYGAVIDTYTRIQCAVCEAFIWTEGMAAERIDSESTDASQAEPLPGTGDR